jgi:aspartate carbamoyltransferase catalytic subunit
VTRHQLFHLTDPDQFDRGFLDEICTLTTDIRRAARQPDGMHGLQRILGDKRAMLYFTQPSTRTFLSFNNACHILGIRTSEIRDSSTSSEVKGETIEDSLRTFSSYVDVIIMRSWQQGLAKRAADLMNVIPRPVPIIDAGSGKDFFNDTATTEIYTLERSFENRGGIDGKTIAMMGDLARGRTVRSLCRLMNNYSDVHLIFIAPDSFAMEPDIKAHLDDHGIAYTETEDLERWLPELDAVYVTRIQSEHDVGGESATIDLSRFSIGREALAHLREDAVIMHPLPRGPELSPEVDADPRAMYWRQERNGMWMRCALLLKILQAEDAFYSMFG